jgi:hypothetical protein
MVKMTRHAYRCVTNRLLTESLLSPPGRHLVWSWALVSMPDTEYVELVVKDVYG